MASTKIKILGILGAAVVAAAGLWLLLRPFTGPFHEDAALEASLNGIVDDFRKTILLGRRHGVAGRREAGALPHRGPHALLAQQEALNGLSRRLADDYRQAAQCRFRSHTDSIRQVIRYLSRNPALHDVDKLAFLDVVEEMESGTAARCRAAQSAGRTAALPQGQPAIHPVDLPRGSDPNLPQFATRGLGGHERKVGRLRRFLCESSPPATGSSAEIGELTTAEPPEAMRGGPQRNFRQDFPPKTVALTFDDGPHPKYTEQILALLRKYGIRACSSSWAKTWGRWDASGNGTWRHRGSLEKGPGGRPHHRQPQLLAPGAAQATEGRKAEIDHTNACCKRSPGHPTDPFRAPYGARNKEILDQVTGKG